MSLQIDSRVQAFRFFVNGKPYESTEQLLTGEEVMAIAGIDPDRQLFLGDHAKGSADHLVPRDKLVDLGELAGAQFYTLAPPNYDIF